MLATIQQHFAHTSARTGLAAPDPAVLAAMARVPREAFVPPELARRAYDDAALSLPHGQTISQPFIVALMTSLLRPRPQHRVLEIGTGSGYQAAVLAEVVGEVHTVERVPELAASAAERLRQLGYTKVRVRQGDGSTGWPDSGPFDGILVACGAETVPPALLDQLAPGGHLVIPVGPRGDQMLLDVHRDERGDLHTREVLDVRFVPFVQQLRAPSRERTETPGGFALRARADDRQQALAELALALVELVADPAGVQPRHRVAFACAAADGDKLAQRWLEEVLWSMARQRLVFRSFEVALHAGSLRAVGLGEPLATRRHGPAIDPAELGVLEAKLAPTEDGWCATCFVTVRRLR